MNQINIATKKFTDAVKIDIGQLPVTDVKIDFNLTDGSNPVIAENKTFSMTIGTVNGELYKTDDDTVSYRYLKFDDNNVADSLAITMKMNGEEILNDTVSLSYQSCGGGGGTTIAVDNMLNESSPNPVANSTLTPIINGKADKATTIAGYGITDAYTKNELSTVATTGSYNDLSNKPDLTTKLDAPAVAGTVGQVLTKTETGSEWDDLPDTTDYLCFTASQANSTVRLDCFGTLPAINLEYSVDKKHWTEYTWNDKTGATITLANIGDSVWMRGNNTAFNLDTSNAYRFTMSGSIEASGNIMSLLDKTCKSVTIPTAYCFFSLFGLCASLKKAPKLPATTLTDSCYYAMFNGCSSLMEAPELPATTLAEFCYDWMFRNCTSLTKAPELPATTMAKHCYDCMFQNCTSLTKAPVLHVTTLAEHCYYRMFNGCSSLMEAELHSKSKFVPYCYNEMFFGCSKLNKVKVDFTGWGSTYNWLSDVSSTGVFECPSTFDCDSRDASHVPAGWAIVRTDSPKSITSPTTASSEATYQVSPNTPSVPVVTVSSALTLNAIFSVASTDIAYSEIVLDVASGATVTAGTNLTLVDEITAGKRNICVCRWSGGVCKLYVTIVEDLPQA